MARFLKKKDASYGQVPGEPVFIGTRRVDDVAIQVIDYTKESLTEFELEDINEGVPFKESDTVTWINIDGLHDSEIMHTIGRAFGLHALTLEDIVNTGQRAKIEEFDEYLFLVVKMMSYDKENDLISSEQLSLVLGPSFLLTFQEGPGDIFDPVRDRIRKSKGRIRGVGIDYLAYTLLDTIVDNYLLIVERIGTQIEAVEGDILENPDHKVLSRINSFKREINYLSKSIRPVREAMLHLSRLDNDLVKDSTRPFLKDLLDLATQTIEIIDTYREVLSDYLNVYNTGIANRLNEIMKVLTIFSAIFIPLTFIAGIYGMNFQYMPELACRYGYPLVLLVMLLVVVTMLGFFKRRKWL